MSINHKTDVVDAMLCAKFSYHNVLLNFKIDIYDIIVLCFNSPPVVRMHPAPDDEADLYYFDGLDNILLILNFIIWENAESFYNVSLSMRRVD